MRAKGICYDTGFIHKGTSSQVFDADAARRDMRAIRDRLRCDAVRVTGGDPERLKIAARHAADAGLEVWLCPFTCDVGADDLLDMLADLASFAEDLRRGGAEIVLLTGSELSIMVPGFVPGDAYAERATRVREAMPEIPALINDFLAKAVAVVRGRFGGKISYASLPFENVDWEPFDYIATDTGYRFSAIADRYPELMRAFASQGKPAAITEFGCATYRGAADEGPASHDVIAYDPDTGAPVGLKRELIRDEAEQARYLTEVLTVLDESGVDTAFWFGFVWYGSVHDPRDPARDFDAASCGVVAAIDDDHHWEPKAAFDALAGYDVTPGASRPPR
ncbi:MAG TPA: hypothetical protein VE172_15680 [Stackebrandtia sp.]|uniref:hypothetical protein n=1 Tax=Stackebrandtia sp. TaxID=2023065 RepID=UPI002D3027C7|nr:hypothetical protein [Stackebrandtia sp.]HZE40244.1 hypothetical protein [Stackebrandtia sp.]